MTCLGCKHYLGGGCCRMNLESECAAGGYEMYEKAAYRYYCRMRPPMICDIPQGGILIDAAVFDERQYVYSVDCMAWGWLEYDRPLTAGEVADYGLISAPREGVDE